MRIKKFLHDAGTILPVIGYPFLFPFFMLMKRSKYISERWYGFFMTTKYAYIEKPIRELKELLFENLNQCESVLPLFKSTGAVRVPEIGPGFGGNFMYYPPNTLLTTIEINDFLEKNFHKLKDIHPNINLEKSIIGNAENMDQVADESVDIVVGTFILCCINDPIAALREIYRVLVPGGKFYTLEFVHHDEGTIKYKLQNAYKPFWKGVSLKCRAGR